MKPFSLLLFCFFVACASNPPVATESGKLAFDEQEIVAELLPIEVRQPAQSSEPSANAENKSTFELVKKRKSFDLISDYSFVTHEAGVMMIDLYDLGGRLVSNIYNGPLKKGAYDIHFIERRINPGVFIIRYRLADYQQHFRTIMLDGPQSVISRQ